MRRINQALRRTGYELRPVAAAPSTPTDRPPTVEPPAPGPSDDAAPAMSGAKSGDGRRLPSHFGQNAVEIIRRVQPRTMTSPIKLFGLISATRYVAAHRIPGAIVECGVWRGGSMQAAALTLLDSGDRDRELHLFDTFAGMPPPTESDSRDGVSAEELLASAPRDAHIWAVASLEDVQAGMAEVGYPPHRIHYHVGRVEQTVPAQAPQQIAILRLDTDWYESTKHELEHLYSRLSPGGVLIIDDYGDWDGARKATEEFLKQVDAPLLLLPLAGGRIAVKPTP